MGDAPDRIRLPKTTAEAWAVETDPALMANGEADWPIYVRADLAPTDAEVEAAAKAIWERADDEFGWEASKAMPHAAAHIEWTLEDARAALLAGRKGRE